MIVVWLFLMMPQVCLQFVIVVFPDHTQVLFLEKFLGKRGQWLQVEVRMKAKTEIE